MLHSAEKKEDDSHQQQEPGLKCDRSSSRNARLTAHTNNWQWLRLQKIQQRRVWKFPFYDYKIIFVRFVRCLPERGAIKLRKCFKMTFLEISAATSTPAWYDETICCSSHKTMWGGGKNVLQWKLSVVFLKTRILMPLDCYSPLFFCLNYFEKISLDGN